jgi:putative tryptophan/tyrosine transport system substrate-binding protein
VITRRAVLAIGAFAVVVRDDLSAQTNMPRIGLLATGSPLPRTPRPVEALREALRKLGYVEGRTIVIEYRWAEGRIERLPTLAVELVGARVDVIVASGDNAIRAAMQATTTVPIVMATSGDAVGGGFVHSLARPGGNVTGMSAMVPEIGAKRLQLLKALRPELVHATVLWNPADPVQAADLRETADAGKALGVTVSAVEFRTPADVDAALAAFARHRPQLLVVFNDTATIARRSEILGFVAGARIPAMFEASEWADEGGLVAYGVTHADLFARSAVFVDRILKGARPSDLPVEQPTRIPLTINIRTARTLGIAVSQPLLLRADRIIE